VRFDELNNVVVVAFVACRRLRRRCISQLVLTTVKNAPRFSSKAEPTQTPVNR